MQQLGYLIGRIFKDQPLRLTLSVLALAAAGLLEGIGVAAIVPMLQLVETGSRPGASVGMFGTVVSSMLGVLGLPFNLATMLGFILFFILGSQAVILVQQKLLAGSSALFEATLRKKLFSAVFDAGWPYFVQTKASDLMSALLSDTARAGAAYITIVTMLGTVIMVFVYMALAFALSWQMTLSTIIASVAVIFLLKNRASQGTTFGEAISQTDADIHSETQENLVAAKLVKASSADLEVEQRFDRLTEVRQRIQYKNLMNQAWLKTIYDSASIAVVFAGIYVAVTFFGMTTATLSVFLFVFYRLSPRISNLQANQHLVLSLIPGVKRVDSFTAQAVAMHEVSGTAPLSGLQETIELRDVSFSYEEKPVLEHLSLTIPRGASTAIVGPSGSGKTTVMDLVMGLLTPGAGDVRIDGRSLRDVALRDWRRHIGYVPQDASFFHATVAENISWGVESATRNDVVDAAKLAHADEFVCELPQGYDTIIGDRGVRLSGGQRQRLALARAIVRQPAVLVLDEATSALDAESEEKIQHAVDGLAGSMTILTVTHRLSTVKGADLIHVLENGKLVESGSWGELLAAGGRFCELADMQTIGPRAE
jgi:ABC-type multidrug transport system fused ATPase/permease subunit